MVDVDVVIPVFDGETFVERAVASVLSQGATGLRLFLVDDASTDRTPHVLARLADAHPEITVLTNPVNVGVSSSRNRAIAAGTAPLVAFLDQDDVWMPGKLARQQAALAADPGLGYVVGRQRFVVEQGSSRPAWCRPEWLESPQAGYLPGTLVARRAVFESIGVFDEGMRAGGDDTDWFARARREAVPALHLDDVLLERHVHDRNLSSDRRTDDEILTLVRRHVAARRSAP